MNSDWDMVPHQRNQEPSSPEVNSEVIIFSVIWYSHYEEMFGMISRHLVCMVDTYTPCTLSTQDINIKIPPELY